MSFLNYFFCFIFSFGLSVWILFALSFLPSQKEPISQVSGNLDGQNILLERLNAWDDQVVELSKEVEDIQRSLGKLQLVHEEHEKASTLLNELSQPVVNLRGNPADAPRQPFAPKRQPQQPAQQTNPIPQPKANLVTEAKAKTVTKPNVQRGELEVQQDMVGAAGKLDWSDETYQKYGWSNAHLSGPVPLIISGTDGSGTRSVVDLMVRLGVNMVIDDRGTNDVEGYELGKGGWPPPVRLVLDAVHTINYEVANLPSKVQTNVSSAVKTFISAMRNKAAKKKKTTNVKASKVEWGFKAPVSMCLVPFLKKELNKMKLLHVVRDGRDIAFSGNQSPVGKFYNNQYTNDRGLGPEAKAIQLWSDWNTQLLEWEKAHGGSEFDYMVIRTEDLVTSESRFAVIRQLADFIGSSLPETELCCIAMEQNKDLGSHSYAKKEKKVTQRYGKWHKKVEGKPALSQSLHIEGKKGLEEFGYEPFRPGDDIPCQCGQNSQPVKHQCNFENDMDYKGQGSDIAFESAKSNGECCDICGDHPKCTYFTYSSVDKLCFLKSSQGNKVGAPNLISGQVTA